MAVYRVEDLEAAATDVDIVAHSLWRGVQKRAIDRGIDKVQFGPSQSQEAAGAILKWLLGLSDYDRKQVTDWLLTRGAK